MPHLPVVCWSKTKIIDGEFLISGVFEHAENRSDAYSADKKNNRF